MFLMKFILAELFYSSAGKAWPQQGLSIARASQVQKSQVYHASIKKKFDKGSYINLKALSPSWQFRLDIL